MAELCVRLFGRMLVQYCGATIAGFEHRKVQELLCYLVLNHQQIHAREVLATLLWCDSPTAQARKQLRHTLWQLQTALDQAGTAGKALLLVEPEWVQVKITPLVWVDALDFGAADARVKDTAPAQLSAADAQLLDQSVRLYQGDLLEGCYQEWCLYEREREVMRLLGMLDRLVQHCLAHGRYEAGVGYGERILRHDRTRERTHRHLMQLHYLSGDRSEALRQFQRCAAALNDELGIEPSQQTLHLADQIRAERLEVERPADGGAAAPIGQIVGDLRQMWSALNVLQQQIKTYIDAIERAPRDPH